MARCVTCQRFVDPAKCNHYMLASAAGGHVEFECERCAAARPWHESPQRALSMRTGER